MMGIVRFLLALMVVKAHIWPTGQPWLAWQSVFAFYTLSGFLMTMVLNENYGFTRHGVRNFLINRFLRLAPAYYIIIATTACLIVIAPLSNLQATIALPITLSDISANLFLLGMVGFDNSQLTQIRISPSAWSLSVEIFCYILLALGFAKTPLRLIVFAIIGLVAVTLSHLLLKPDWNYGPYNFQNHYTVLQSGFIPFALGGFSYYYRHAISTWKPLKIVIMILLGTNLAASFYSEIWQHFIGFLIASLIMALTVPLLIKAQLKNHIDGWLGALSYPLFLMHWGMASLIARHLALSPSFTLFYLTLIASIVACIPIVLVERKVMRLRRNFKP